MSVQSSDANASRCFFPTLHLQRIYDGLPVLSIFLHSSRREMLAGLPRSIYLLLLALQSRPLRFRYFDFSIV